MSDKRRFLDVWIIENNTVYKEVPFEVVVDWVQQGRLLEDDMLKPSGTRDWFRLGASPDFSPYLLKPVPGRVEDTAEALEPIGEDFPVKRSPAEDEDEDVDMIPLIDVSLVLLVFFMLIGTGAAVAGFVNVPETTHGQMVDSNRSLRVDITQAPDGTFLYAVAAGDAPAGEDERDIVALAALLDRLKARVVKATGPVEIVINADRKIPARVPRDVLVAMRAEPFRGKVTANYFGVAGKREE